jgi:hypothetical protein
VDRWEAVWVFTHVKECKIKDQFYRFQHGDLQVEFLEDGCNTEVVIMTIKYLITVETMA